MVSTLEEAQPFSVTQYAIRVRRHCERLANCLQAQGSFKYGGYEFFKKFYSDLAGEENAYKYKTMLYLTASASAEFIADIALCPFEAVKVRMQTSIPPFATGTLNGISQITAKEGYAG